MNASTVAVDLAKSVFQLAVADEHGRVVVAPSNTTASSCSSTRPTMSIDTEARLFQLSESTVTVSQTFFMSSSEYCSVVR